MLIQTSLYPYVHRRNVQYPYGLCCIVELHVGWVLLVQYEFGLSCPTKSSSPIYLVTW